MREGVKATEEPQSSEHYQPAGRENTYARYPPQACSSATQKRAKDARNYRLFDAQTSLAASTQVDKLEEPLGSILRKQSLSQPPEKRNTSASERA